MNILIVGGTRFFGIPMVNRLIDQKHSVTIATRGRAHDPFGYSVSRVTLDRADPESIKAALGGTRYDVIIDKIAYCSNDVKQLLDHVSCDRYILMSSAAVYPHEHDAVCETEFDAKSHPFTWCFRENYNYGEVKRQAECAVSQVYNLQPYTFVRYPVVLGENDYTKRLFFYVQHVLNRQPMYIDNMEKSMSFIHEKEAGEFIAHLVERPVEGAINGCSLGSISPGKILSYIEQKCGIRSILSKGGDVAPYNGSGTTFTLDIQKALNSGFCFSSIDSWIYDLLDKYIWDMQNI